MSNQEPYSEDGLRKNIENGIRNDLGVNGCLSGAIGDSPDAASYQLRTKKSFERATYIGYTVQRMRVKAANEPKSLLTRSPLALTTAKD